MKRLLPLLIGLLVTAPGWAQRKVVADKIVAIVGDKIILQSDVDNAIADMQRQGVKPPPDAQCDVLQQMLTMKALVLQAEKDSIVVSDEEIDALLDNQIRGFINMYGSKEALEQIAGRSVYQIKEDFRQSFKERRLAEEMQKKIVSNVKVTPQEVEDYWNKLPKDSLRFYESQYEIGEIIVNPKPSRELEKLAIDELNEYKKEVESGQEKFETLAKLYSDDPGSKDNGGRYAINRNEKNFDPAFINNAFRLKEGEISPVFKTKFGYHIIKMISRAGDDAVVEHILRIPHVTDVQINEAVDKLDSVRAQLIAGTLSFGEAVDKYSEDDNSKYTGGMVQCGNGSTACTIDQLDKDLVLSLDKMKVGEYSKPIEFTDQSGKKAIRLLYLRNRTAPHRENLKQDYDVIAQRALKIKQQQVLEKWFTEKIPTYYLMIDKNYASCDALNNWLRYASRVSQ